MSFRVPPPTHRPPSRLVHRRHRLRRACVAVLGAALVGTLAPVHAAGFVVRILPGLGGPASSTAGLDDEGDVVGNATTPDGLSTGVLWLRGRGPAHAIGGMAHGINDHGWIALSNEVLRPGRPPVLLQGDTHAWGIGPQGEAYGEMDLGYAMLCTRTGICRHLPDLPDGNLSFVAGLNRAGTAVGATNVSGMLFPAIWVADQAIALPPLGLYGEADAVNDDEVIVGRGSDLRRRAIPAKWIARQPVELPAPGEGQALAVNRAGDAVGWCTVAGTNHAMLWPASGGYVDLDDFLDAARKAEGWVIDGASGINEAGLIAATMSNASRGLRKAVLLQPTP